MSAPICVACGMQQGVGLFDQDGRLLQPDPAPSDPGIELDGRWFCTEECQEYFLTGGDVLAEDIEAAAREVSEEYDRAAVSGVLGHLLLRDWL